MFIFENLKKIRHGTSGKEFRQRAWAYFYLLIGNRFLSVQQRGYSKLLGGRYHYSKRGSLYGMFKEIFVEQNYYFEATNEPLTIVDCGTNIGLSLVYFRRQAPQAKIIAFEPNPHTFKLVSENVEKNNLSVTLHNVGLGATSKKVLFYTDAHDLESQSASTTQHLASKKYELTSFSVQIEPLSKYLEKTVDILKLDIEGAEGEVLSELADSGKLKLVKKLFIEYHFDGVHTTFPLGKLLSTLETAGFQYVLESAVELPFSIVSEVQSVSYKIIAWRL
jgi:FkbM family methyltransferase